MIKIEKDVGFMGVDDSDPNNIRIYYELDLGSNCWGDIDEFYRDTTEDHSGGGICYIRSLEEERLYSDDPAFKAYAYTYDDVLAICNGNEAAAKIALEEAGGYCIETMWYELEDIVEDE